MLRGWLNHLLPALCLALSAAALLGAAAPALADNPVVEIKTSAGTITAELYADKTPKTVANFLEYAKSGFYDGTVFHRVIDGFMIQGGGFDKNMQEKPTRAPIENEAGDGARAGLKNVVGTLSMARTSSPHSATAQFFINIVDNPPLDFRSPTPQGFGYAVFGKVTKGLDVAQHIAKVPTGTVGPFENVPRTPVVIESVKVVAPK
jgi:peptidyl-prolyl cis-trans isomerase A (cyclophilin A)